MSRVAIHLTGAPIDRNVLRAVFRSVQGSGGRVVSLTDDARGETTALQSLAERLGDDFEQLFTVVRDEVYEYVVQDGSGPNGAYTAEAA